MSNRDIYYVEPDWFGPHTLRVKEDPKDHMPENSFVVYTEGTNYCNVYRLDR